LRRRANAADGLLRQTRHRGAAHTRPRSASGLRSDLTATARSGQFSHPALFYRSAEEYVAGTVPFIVAGLDAGEAVAVAVPTENLALIREGLDQLASQVQLLDMTRVGRNPGRIIASVLLAFAQDHADRRVRIIDESVWSSRTAEEYPACVRHEALINVAFADQPATIMCPYDSGRLDAQILSDAARTHPVVIDEAGSRASDRYAPYEALDAYNLPLPGTDIDNALVLDVNSANQAQARAAAVAHAGRLGLPTGRHSDVEIVVAELASNSVLHGGGGGQLIVGSAAGHILCQVQDRGTQTDLLAGCQPIAEDQPAGRGLLTVNRAADLVRTYAVAGCTVTRAYFRIGAQ
jgi:anti-sigma regulatory factor (Ser/Thr protein kinase)